MTRPLPAELEADERLVAELRRLGVRHLARLSSVEPHGRLSPEQLVAGLAEHGEARLRGALILLFLRQPRLSPLVQPVLPRLSPAGQNTLRLYYQAAVYLQRELEPILRERLQPRLDLPDDFSAELGLPPASTVTAGPGGADVALRALGEAQRRLTGWDYNWAGSYRQHIPRFLKHLAAADAAINS